MRLSPRLDRVVKAAAFVTAVLGAVFLAGCGASVVPSVHSDAERMTVGRRLLDQGQMNGAIELFKSYI